MAATWDITRYQRIRALTISKKIGGLGKSLSRRELHGTSAKLLPRLISRRSVDVEEQGNLNGNENEKGYGGTTVDEQLADPPRAGSRMGIRRLPSVPLGLPLSPFMDPKRRAAKEKHILKKSSPNEHRTQFQIKLSNSPYALALATPIRLCQLTKVRLPKYFLQGFGLLANPETNEPWLVPQGLVSKHRQQLKIGKVMSEIALGSQLDEEHAIPSHTSRTKDETSSDGEAVSNLAPPNTENVEAFEMGGSSYALCRQMLLESFQDKKSGYGDGWKRLLSARALQEKYTRAIIVKTNWRDDTGIFILELMRRRLCEGLENSMSKNRGYLRAAVSCDAAGLKKRQAAAILWTGPQGSDELHEEQAYIPEFAMVGSGSDRLPVFNLRRLLGKEHLSRLKSSKLGIFKSEWVLLKRKRMTVEDLMRLWKLEGYMASQREFSVADNGEDSPSNFKGSEGEKLAWPGATVG